MLEWARARGIGRIATRHYGRLLRRAEAPAGALQLCAASMARKTSYFTSYGPAASR